MAKLYIDTNVIIDSAEERKNICGKDIGECATHLFYEVASCKHHVIFSTWTLQELTKHINEESLKFLFAIIKKKIITIKYDNQDKEKAKQLSKENSADALHVVLAEKANADIIVTRNTDDFIGLTKISIKRPELI